MPAATKSFGNRYRMSRTDPQLVSGGKLNPVGIGRFSQSLISTIVDMSYNHMGPNAINPRVRFSADPTHVISDLHVTPESDVVRGLQWKLDNFQESTFRGFLEEAIIAIMLAWLAEDYNSAYVVDIHGIHRVNSNSDW